MGLLDNILKTTAPAAEGSQSPLISAVLSMLTSGQGGGITGLVQQFTAKGLGNIISSWIGTGENLPISPDQILSVFGSEQIGAIATKAGLTPDATKTGLAQILPQVINQLTPKGVVPEGDLLSKGMDLLKQKLSA
jgi:uncharacterized protein YidB (DUF937 family)